MRLRVLQMQAPRVIALADDGPLALEAGDVVVVAVVKSLGDAADVIAKLATAGAERADMASK